MFESLTKKFSQIFSRYTGKTLTEASLQSALQDVRTALLDADVPCQVIDTFLQDVKRQALNKQLVSSLQPAEHLVKVVHDRLVEFLGGSSVAQFSFSLPATIMLMGLQGSGKTSTCAKLARLIAQQAQERNKKRRIMLASVDFYRPAAVEQLAQLAQRLQVECFVAPSADPLEAARQIKQAAQQQAIDVLIVDTAGRLHVDDALLSELTQLDALVKPTHKVLVLDGMIGQESLSVAQTFNERVGYMGAILTKMDSDTRGGVAFAFNYVLSKPILFAALGEKVEDLEPFRPERMARRILGMGDMQTLLERAEKTIKHDDKQKLEKAIKKGAFTLDDFAQQMSMMSKMGSLSSLMKYMPGIGSVSVTPEMLEQGEKELSKFRAILSSMTPKERQIPKLLDGSRKKRIARGAGVTPTDVNMLLSRFEQTQQYATLLKKMGNKRF